MHLEIFTLSTNNPKLLHSNPQPVPAKPPPNKTPILSQCHHLQLPLTNILQPPSSEGLQKCVQEAVSLGIVSNELSFVLSTALKSLFCWYFKGVIFNMGVIEAISSPDYELKVWFCPGKRNHLPSSYRIWKHHIFSMKRKYTSCQRLTIVRTEIEKRINHFLPEKTVGKKNTKS